MVRLTYNLSRRLSFNLFLGRLVHQTGLLLNNNLRTSYSPVLFLPAFLAVLLCHLLFLTSVADAQIDSTVDQLRMALAFQVKHDLDGQFRYVKQGQARFEFKGGGWQLCWVEEEELSEKELLELFVRGRSLFLLGSLAETELDEGTRGIDVIGELYAERRLTFLESWIERAVGGTDYDQVPLDLTLYSLRRDVRETAKRRNWRGRLSAVLEGTKPIIFIGEEALKPLPRGPHAPPLYYELLVDIFSYYFRDAALAAQDEGRPVNTINLRKLVKQKVRPILQKNMEEWGIDPPPRTASLVDRLRLMRGEAEFFPELDATFLATDFFGTKGMQFPMAKASWWWAILIDEFNRKFKAKLRYQAADEINVARILDNIYEVIVEAAEKADPPKKKPKAKTIEKVLGRLKKLRPSPLHAAYVALLDASHTSTRKSYQSGTRPGKAERKRAAARKGSPPARAAKPRRGRTSKPPPVLHQPGIPDRFQGNQQTHAWLNELTLVEQTILFNPGMLPADLIMALSPYYHSTQVLNREAHEAHRRMHNYTIPDPRIGAPLRSAAAMIILEMSAVDLATVGWRAVSFDVVAPKYIDPGSYIPLLGRYVNYFIRNTKDVRSWARSTLSQARPAKERVVPQVPLAPASGAKLPMAALAKETPAYGNGTENAGRSTNLGEGRPQAEPTIRDRQQLVRLYEEKVEQRRNAQHTEADIRSARGGILQEILTEVNEGEQLSGQVALTATELGAIIEAEFPQKVRGRKGSSATDGAKRKASGSAERGVSQNSAGDSKQNAAPSRGLRLDTAVPAGFSSDGKATELPPPLMLKFLIDRNPLTQTEREGQLQRPGGSAKGFVILPETDVALPLDLDTHLDGMLEGFLQGKSQLLKSALQYQGKGRTAARLLDGKVSAEQAREAAPLLVLVMEEGNKLGSERDRQELFTLAREKAVVRSRGRYRVASVETFLGRLQSAVNQGGYGRGVVETVRRMVERKDVLIKRTVGRVGR